MLFKQLDRIKRSVIMTTIILMVVGNALMFVPEEYIGFVEKTLSFALLVVSVISIFDFISSSRTLINYLYLSAGLLAGLFGIMLFTFDGLLLMLLSWLVGTIPILFGAYGIYHAIAFARKSGRKGWWILIILSSALMLFGGTIFMNPWVESSAAVLKVIGGSMMFSSIVSALSLIWLWPLHGTNE